LSSNEGSSGDDGGIELFIGQVQIAGADFLALDEHAELLADELERLVGRGEVLLVDADLDAVDRDGHRLLRGLHVLDQLAEHPRLVDRDALDHFGLRLGHLFDDARRHERLQLGDALDDGGLSIIRLEVTARSLAVARRLRRFGGRHALGDVLAERSCFSLSIRAPPDARRGAW
jgi:hypothetical protein